MTGNAEGRGAPSLGTSFCPKCRTGYKLTALNMGHRSICVKCGQNFHLLPASDASATRWLDTTAALNQLAGRVWERGLDLRVGQVVLGVYVVQETLGRGGLGQVFKVRHQEWQRELALKLPHRSVMEPKYFQSLKTEAETWVGLGLHPHVVTCWYVRPLMGVPSIFMEYVSGGSVKDLSEPVGGAPPRLYLGDETQRTLRILDLAIQTGWGLEHAHSRGVLHLDIKPQNLLLEEDSGRLLVTDFGLARAAIDTASPTDSASLWPGDLKGDGSERGPERGPERSSERGAQPGAGQGTGSRSQPPAGGFGTPQYMSPEAMERAQPSAGFDLWAASLTLLELFLGRRPWEYGSAVGQALDQYVASVRPAVPIPPSVLAFLRRSLDADPARRHQKASEHTADLIAIYRETSGGEYPRPHPLTTRDSADDLNNRAVSLLDLGRPGEAERLWRQALKEDPGHVPSFYNLALHRFHQKTMPPDVFQGRLDDLVRLAAGRPAPELPLMLAGAYLELGLADEAEAALAAWSGPALTHEVRRLREILDRSRRNPELVERVRPAIMRLSRVGDRPADEAAARRLPELLSLAGEALAAGDDGRAMGLLKEARRLPGGPLAPGLGRLWRQLYGRMDRGDLREIAEAPAAGPGGEVAASGGRILAVGGDRSVRFVADPCSEAPKSVELRLAMAPAALAVAASGAIAAALTSDGHLWLFNPLTGAGAGQAMAHAPGGGACVWRPDGRRLFTAGSDGELKMWDTSYGYLDKGTPLLVKKLGDLPLLALAAAPNGRLISATDGLVEWRLQPERPAGPVRSLPMAPPGEPAREVRLLAADPLNRFLISVHREGLTFHPLWDTDWRADLGAVDAPATALAMSPDAALWAVALADGRLLVGLAPEERRPAFLPLRRIEAGPVHHLSFSRDNGALAAVGRASVSIYSLDWDLEPAKPKGWDKRADAALRNFMARQADAPFSDAMLQAFESELSSAGLAGLDPRTAAARLKEAVAKQAEEY